MVDLGTTSDGFDLPVVTVSADEIDYVRERLGLDALPVVLGGASPHTSVTDHHEAMQSAAASLSTRDLLPGGEIHHELSARLRVLTHPRWELALRRHVGGAIARLCIAQGEFICVGATVEESGTAPRATTLRTITSEPAVPVVDALGAADAMDIAVINAPTDALSAAFAAAPDADGVIAALVRAGVPTEDARILGSAIVTCTSFAELVGLTHPPGAAVSMAGVVTVYDTLSGRLVGSSSRAADGIEWTSLSSGTPQRLRHAVTALAERLDVSDADSR